MTLANIPYDACLTMAGQFLEPLKKAGYFEAHLNLNNPGGNSLVEQLSEYIKVVEYDQPNYLQLEYERLENLEWTIFSLHSSGQQNGQQIDFEFIMLYDPHMHMPYFEINGLRYTGPGGISLHQYLDNEIPSPLEFVVAARHPYVSTRRHRMNENDLNHGKKL
ncbi:hypothetical protein [Chitinophaga sp. XS-30]|uniref:hypothetical protein n=1 Tax=Chitinophaga sp. XS-30 TaxID=2604421 RepID=UPI0011DD7FD1|nr:hypothetical protein [Chitinophaga sp. XS-30]QEH39466.1 hypothetical protein FW415_00685 [Chitinophaga sp. XS-30]